MRVYRGLSFAAHASNMRLLLGLLMICIGWWPVMQAGTAWADVGPASGTIMPPLSPKPLPMLAAPVPHTPIPRVVSNVADPGLMCRAAVVQAGRNSGIPDHLMSAIARIESGRRGADGQVNPWPWSINVEGTDHIYDTRDLAIAAVRSYQASGVRSIDVGCMQVNLLFHPNAFASLEQAFDPLANANYAAHFLKELFEQTGSWPKATAGYHSLNPALGDPYQRKVASVMNEEAGADATAAGSGVRMAMGPDVPGIFGMAPPTGARLLGNHSENVHIIPSANAAPGRDLAAYRMIPVRVAGRP